MCLARPASAAAAAAVWPGAPGSHSQPPQRLWNGLTPTSTNARWFRHTLARTPKIRIAGLARAQCGTIRLKLLKILSVRIRVSVRAVRLSFDEGFPEAGLFGQVLARLQSLPLRC